MSSPTRRSTSWHWQRPCRRTSRLGARRSRPGSTSSSRSRLPRRRVSASAHPARRGSRQVGADAGTHLPLQPPVVAVRDLIESGELESSTSFRRAGSTSVSTSRTSASPGTSRAPISRFCATGWTRHRSGSAQLLAAASFPRFPDVAFIDLEFSSGTLAHVELSWLAPSKLRRTTIVGSRKMVVYDDTSGEPVRVFDSGVVLKDRDVRGIPSHVPHG